MKIQRVVLQGPVDVAIRLKELGLTPDILREAVSRGQAARETCTPNDPPAMVGIFGWGRTVRALRELLLSEGWDRSEDDNLSTVVNESKDIAIAVALGDALTGTSPPQTPKTKYPRGIATAAAIERNVSQLELFPPDQSIPRPYPAKRITWLLLVCPTENEVRCELSLPASVGEDDRVEAWMERIVLEPIGLDPNPNTKADSEPAIE